MRITRGDYEITIAVLDEMSKRLKKSKRLGRELFITFIKGVKKIVLKHQKIDSKNWSKR